MYPSARLRAISSRSSLVLPSARARACLVREVASRAGLDRLHGVPDVLVLDDVVPVEHVPGSVTRHPHHDRLRDSPPAGVRDEAPPEIVEPDVRQLRLPPSADEELASVFPPRARLRVHEDEVGAEVPRKALQLLDDARREVDRPQELVRSRSRPQAAPGQPVRRTCVRREIVRLSSNGYLITESPLYRAADAPANAPGLPKRSWVAAKMTRGMARAEARAHIDAAIAGGRLVPVERRFTTQTAVEREKRILRIERDGRGAVQPIGGADRIRSRLAASDLNEGQRAAVELITTSPHRVVAVQGYAGTGKSHMLDHAKGLAEEHGHRIVAVAPYAAHVRVLRDLGVEAKTLASLLAARDKELDEKTVLVIDEAGTVPTRQMEQALTFAEQSGARIVLLGDTAQTKAIESGRPFHQLQAAGMQTAIMAEIERQKDPALREAVSLAARGQSESSLARLSDIREVRDDHERRRAIAADYARLPEEERASTIVVAGTNEARREINRAIRENLGLAGRGHEFATLNRRDTTQAERAFSKNYSPGDTIQPERAYAKAGLSRGELYEVVENGPGNRLTVRGENGEAVQFSPMTCRRLSVYEPDRSELAAGDRVRITRNDPVRDLANGDRFVVADVTRTAVILSDGKRTVALPTDKPLHLDHSYATTVHASQGTTAERVLIDATTRSRTTSQEVFYVAISRARQEARVYTDDIARLPAAVAREHAKHAALDLRRTEHSR